MAKDPAMLWYWNDWYSATTLYSRFLKGCYMDVLHAQFNNGRLSIEEIKICLGSDFGTSWPTLQKKFTQDENGLFFNERLEREKEKRQVFTESRKQNLSKKTHMKAHMSNHMGKHMDNENRNENRNEKQQETRKKSFLTDQAWKEQFCMAKGIKMDVLEALQKEWIADVDLMGEPIDNYKKYFTNYYNKNLPEPKNLKRMVL